MKRTFAGVLAGAMLFAGAASAANPTAKKIAALQKDVKTLKSTVKKQQRTINLLANALIGNFVADACFAAATSDALQGTWATVDQAVGHSVFGTQSAISDRGACGSLSQPSVTREGIRTPPTTNVFSTMISWLCGQSCGGSSAFALSRWR